MKNIFILDANESLSLPGILKFGDSISSCIPTIPHFTPLQTFVLELIHHYPVSTTNPLTALAEAIISLYTQFKYTTISDYAKRPFTDLNPNSSLYEILNSTVANDIYELFSTAPNNATSNNHPLYKYELVDFLMLSYNYSNSLKKIPIKNIEVSNYLKNLLKKDGIEPRAFSDMRWRQRKANNKKTILPLFIDAKKSKLDSYFDIEILSNLFRFTNKSKNPFMTNIQSDKITKIDKFLGSFQHISLKEAFLDLPNSIASERLFSHNQFILERITNINFILFLWAVKNSVKQKIHSSLLDELYHWATFPLLNTRLRLLNSIFTIFNTDEEISLKEQEALQRLLRAIRLYHSNILLPLLVYSFHYAASLSFNEKDIKDDVLKKELNSLKKFIQKEAIKEDVKEHAKKIDILLNPQKSTNEYLKEYFLSPSVLQRLRYFEITKKTNDGKEKLYPIAYKIYLDTFDGTLKESFDKIHGFYTLSQRLLFPLNSIGMEVYNKFSEYQQIYTGEKTLLNLSLANVSHSVFSSIYFYENNWGIIKYY